MKGEKMKDEGEKKMTGGGVKCLFLSVVINLFWAGHLLYWLGRPVMWLYNEIFPFTSHQCVMFTVLTLLCVSVYVYFSSIVAGTMLQLENKALLYSIGR